MIKELYTTIGAEIGTLQQVGVKGNNKDDVSGAIIGIINIVLSLLSIACVIVIIISGINFMTSNGDAGKVKKAKDTILYAVIGLIVCATAAIVVNYVINSIINPTGNGI